MAEKIWGRCFDFTSPIKIIEPDDTTINSFIETAAKRIARDFDGMIYSRVLAVGVDVSKEELEKALRYDRGQYEKGYADGLKNANIVHGRWVRDPVTGFTVCSYCGMPPPGDAELECFYESDYCPKCGALMDGDVDEGKIET